MTKRTQEEIVARINERKEQDMLGFEWHEYLECLDYEHAKPMMRDGVTPEQWPATTFDPRRAIIDYLPFAFEKAHNERSISAGRSVSHIVAWTWLDGEDELSAWCADDNNYYGYGLDILRKVAQHYGVDVSDMDRR